MKRWLAIGALLAGLVAAYVPRGNPPGGCITEYLSPDSVMFIMASCDPSVNDTLTWRGKSDHQRCSMRFQINVDQRYMQIGRSIECTPRSVDTRRVATLPNPPRLRGE